MDRAGLGRSERERLDREGRLRGSHLEDDWSLDRDRDDAAALLAVARGLAALNAGLEQQGVSPELRKQIDGRLSKRAAREVVERIWERPRRRTAGQKVLSDKFAHGGLWTPPAARLVLTGDWSGRLTLEHVVPAQVITDALVHRAEAHPEDAEGAARVLHELVTHVVITGDDDRALSRHLQPKVRNELLDHYSGSNPVTHERLFDLRWSRYLDAAEAGRLSFELADLHTLDYWLAQENP